MAVQNSLYHIALAVPVLILVSIAFHIFYNLYLHPLRSYPGPPLGRATGLYMHKKLLDGALPKWIDELHKKYGAVVRYAPNEVSFIDANAVKDVYSHHSTAFKKDMDFYGPGLYGKPPGLIQADNASHARQRKLMSHAFSAKALRGQEDLLKGYMCLLVKKLQERATTDGQVDMVRWFNYATFDVMADLTFGEPLKCLEESDYTPWVVFIFGSLKMNVFTRILRPWKNLHALAQRLVPKQVREMHKANMDHCATCVDKRLARKTERPDIWSYILRHVGGEEGLEKSLTPSEMYNNSATFMIAGTETTATELSGMTYYLLKNPEKMERLKKEIRSAFKSLDDVHMQELSQLKYLNACIEEGLRIYPPVPVGLPRKVPAGGAVVDGNWMPGGTIVSLPHYAAFHSPDNFKDPDSFVPERWLPEGEAEYGADRKDVFIPFSNGPRNCLGKSLAYHEMRLLCAGVTLNFDLELVSQDDWTDQKVYILWDKNPLMVKLTPVTKA
ncbi:benzoate 4-monooxygenase cytochrome P450 [Byssothecium circinans]|uniref:Benzoate 4-monooxygenase cytochrome P450 n=1 Tax=Byssothecium circinans TaxID=147558 RepID=A0A6A5UG18_9PLEO|nr:benzoate 4-monooxygenase cytochrome P450 [Byssothecium circinans]